MHKFWSFTAKIAIVLAALFLGLLNTSAHVDYILLGTLGENYSIAQDNNYFGQVVGISDSGYAYRGFLWQDGVMTNLETDDPLLDSGATGINDHGIVVGWAWMANGERHAVLWENGQMLDLGTLGGTESTAAAINKLGQVVGVSGRSNDAGSHAFLWKEGVMIDLGTLGGEQSAAYDINIRGQIVGDSRIADENRHAFLWYRGAMSDLGTLGGDQSTASGINKYGQVTGASQLANGEWQAFLWKNGTLEGLGTLGGNYSQANDINNFGHVVGFSTIASGEQHAFLWKNGEMIDLSETGSVATSVNDRCEIVGFIGREAVMWIYPCK